VGGAEGKANMTVYRRYYLALGALIAICLLWIPMDALYRIGPTPWIWVPAIALGVYVTTLRCPQCRERIALNRHAIPTVVRSKCRYCGHSLS
jgi:hypothetical protein